MASHEVTGLDQSEMLLTAPHPFLVLPLSSNDDQDKTDISDLDTISCDPGELTVQLIESRQGEDLILYPIRRHTPSRSGSTRVWVGRSDKADICIPDERISKLHAFIEQASDGTGYLVVDNGSRNGTRVNSTDLQAKQPHSVQLGDVVAFGPFAFHFLSGPQIVGRMAAGA